jgi:histidyl-tRNA synthetase
MKITAIKGFQDILPPESYLWRLMEEKAHLIFERYNFREVRIPILEKTELFTRSIGEATDIVEKEMYTFLDRDQETTSMTLRPEGTASLVRAYIEAGIYNSEQVSKLYYMGPMFRRERPQKGRYRQFYQIGAELLGRSEPATDSEVLLMLMDFFRELKIPPLTLELNSLGCTTCRPVYKGRLVGFAESKKKNLCENCNRRIDRNPLRLLDCKETLCQKQMKDAPSILDSLCAPCQKHFCTVEDLLSSADLSYRINPRMVRGLDYYCRTTFEVTTEELGAQRAVAAGGRYDGLVAELGGPDIPGIGFAVGIERVVALMRQAGTEIRSRPRLFVASIGDAALRRVYPIVHRLRNLGVAVELDSGERSLKSQMRRADRMRAEFVLIVGEEEVAKGKGILREMRSQRQQEVDLDAGIENLSSRLGEQ